MEIKFPAYEDEDCTYPIKLPRETFCYCVKAESVGEVIHNIYSEEIKKGNLRFICPTYGEKISMRFLQLTELKVFEPRKQRLRYMSHNCNDEIIVKVKVYV